jgi:hypothetical protein
MQQALEATKKEELARRKYERLVSFYRDYADKELTRVITSLLSNSKEAINSNPTTESIRDLSEGELALQEMDADF